MRRHTVRVLLVAVAVLGALVLVGGLANAAPAVTGGSTGAKGTCTTLVTSPATTVAQGAQVTLTAMVAPAAAAGMVQFKDAATDLGAAVAVTNGTAATMVTFPTAGMHSLTAVFTPTNSAAFKSSTSPAVPLTVTGAAPSPAAVQVTTPAQVVTPAPAQVTVLSATDDNQGLVSTVVEGASNVLGEVL